MKKKNSRLFFSFFFSTTNTQPQKKNMKKSNYSSHFDEKSDIVSKEDDEQSNKKQKTENDTKMSLSKLYELAQNEKQMEDYLRREFEEIEKQTDIINENANYYSAKLYENSHRNRYDDISPPENTRVLLERIGTISGDYINANFIDGAIKKSNKRFIATQGPLKNTIDDFWNMIFDNNVPMIVMLTKLKDSNGSEKCAKYWPNVVGNKIYTEDDRLVITLDLEEQIHNGNMVKREFTIKNQKSTIIKTVTQIHLVSWPDQGVLDSCDMFIELTKSTDLTDFTKNLDVVDNVKHHPIVVHCSAGVGRTGVYIVIQNVLQKLIADVKKSSTPKETEIAIDVPSILLRLREQRSHCVQTLEQYIFCYKTIHQASKIILQLKEKESLHKI
jgi:protein tyrosine phosphatase